MLFNQSIDKIRKDKFKLQIGECLSSTSRMNEIVKQETCADKTICVVIEIEKAMLSTCEGFIEQCFGQIG